VKLEVVWEDPPPSRKGQGKRTQHRGEWQRVMVALVQHPGRWAKVATASRGTQLSMTQQRMKNWPGRWEVVTRQAPDDGSASLYVRFVGNDDEAAS
jgi:hypothetical protein